MTVPAYTHEDTGDTVAQDLDLADSPTLADLARRLATEEQGRAGIDRGWIGAFAVTLFGIHLGRMGLDRRRSVSCRPSWPCWGPRRPRSRSGS
jgi:hypothetical protein